MKKLFNITLISLFGGLIFGCGGGTSFNNTDGGDDPVKNITSKIGSTYFFKLWDGNFYRLDKNGYVKVDTDKHIGDNVRTISNYYSQYGASLFSSPFTGVDIFMDGDVSEFTFSTYSNEENSYLKRTLPKFINFPQPNSNTFFKYRTDMEMPKFKSFNDGSVSIVQLNNTNYVQGFFSYKFGQFQNNVWGESVEKTVNILKSLNYTNTSNGGGTLTFKTFGCSIVDFKDKTHAILNCAIRYNIKQPDPNNNAIMADLFVGQNVLTTLDLYSGTIGNIINTCITTYSKYDNTAIANIELPSSEYPFIKYFSDKHFILNCLEGPGGLTLEADKGKTYFREYIYNEQDLRYDNVIANYFSLYETPVSTPTPNPNPPARINYELDGQLNDFKYIVSFPLEKDYMCSHAESAEYIRDKGDTSNANVKCLIDNNNKKLWIKDSTKLTNQPIELVIPSESSELVYFGMYPDPEKEKTYRVVLIDEDMEQKAVEFSWVEGSTFLNKVESKDEVFAKLFDKVSSYEPSSLSTTVIKFHSLSNHFYYFKQ